MYRGYRRWSAVVLLSNAYMYPKHFLFSYTQVNSTSLQGPTTYQIQTPPTNQTRSPPSILTQSELLSELPRTRTADPSHPSLTAWQQQGCCDKADCGRGASCRALTRASRKNQNVEKPYAKGCRMCCRDYIRRIDHPTRFPDGGSR